MLIGLTYDLRDDYLKAGFSGEDTAEFDSDEVIQGLEKAIGALGHRTDRIGNVRHLIKRLVQGDSWDLVFNIAEGLRGFGRARFPVSWMPTTFPIPFPTRWCCPWRCTRA